MSLLIISRVPQKPKTPVIFPVGTAEKDEWLRHMRGIAVPQRLSGFPRDARGYVITYSAYFDLKGIPQFLTPDERRRLFCAENRLCQMCGQPLDSEIVSIAGEDVLTSAVKKFEEPFMHEECAHYAAQVCPFLAHARFTEYVKKLPTRQGTTVSRADEPRERPEKMIFYVTDDYEYKVVEERSPKTGQLLLCRAEIFANTQIRSAPLPPRFEPSKT